MCDLIPFREDCARTRRRHEKSSGHEELSGKAEIIIFPGVRYMRMPDPVEAPKPTRAPKRRSAAKKKKAV